LVYTDVGRVKAKPISLILANKKKRLYGFVQKGTKQGPILSERAEIKRDGAKAQKNSGRGKYAKGDAILGNFLVDYKEATESFDLNKKVWAKICTDTFKVSRELQPCLKVIMGKDNEKVRLGIVEWSYLEQLIKLAELTYEENDG
jgi:hypothetical protein